MDNSYIKDWSSHRMLARFGLPHLRARHVRVRVNWNNHGLYTLLEAPDQEYVFHRSFPDYDPTNYALYKVKTMAMFCEQWSDKEFAAAKARFNETTKDGPYSFQRGTHKSHAVVLGRNATNFLPCLNAFFSTIFENNEDTALAYLRADEDCAKMIMDTGLIDRDLGTNNWDDTMEQFVRDHLGINECDEGCANSNLIQVSQISFHGC